MGGVDRVFAGEHSKSCCYARTYHHEVLQEGKTGAYSNSALSKPASFNKEAGYIFPDCLEEDNTEDTFKQKFRLAVKYHSLLSYQSILNYLHNCINAAPSFGGLVADKYIVQRVLRV
jgi:23S rRNA G2069 N7-methylase RlmK/C1962 C5-methylase RlmI